MAQPPRPAPVCPMCGGPVIEQKMKLICAVCHAVCETCCEGGPVFEEETAAAPRRPVPADPDEGAVERESPPSAGGGRS